MSDIRLAAEVVAEVKKAVVGKDDILVKALLAVLARGHILLEDIRVWARPPWRWPFQGTGACVSPRPVHARRDALRHHRLFSTTRRLDEWSTSPGRCYAISSWPMNSTGPPAAPSRRCWRPWRRGRSRWTDIPSGAPALPGHCHPESGGGLWYQLLPDSQLDRFTLRLSIGYPRPEDELELLRRRRAAHP